MINSCYVYIHTCYSNNMCDMHIASVNTVINSYYVNITRYLNKQAIAKIVQKD